MTRKPKEPTSLQRARKAHAERLRDQGYKPKTFWLSADALAALSALKAKHDSEGAAVNAALIEAARRHEENSAAYYALYGAVPKDDAAPPQKPQEPAPKAQSRQTPDKTVKAVREAPARTAGAKLGVPFGPTPRKPGDLAKKGTRK